MLRAIISIKCGDSFVISYFLLQVGFMDIYFVIGRILFIDLLFHW